MTVTGSMLELPQLLTNSTSEERLASQLLEPTMEETKDMEQNHLTSDKLEARTSDTASNNLKTQDSLALLSINQKTVQSKLVARP